MYDKHSWLLICNEFSIFMKYSYALSVQPRSSEIWSGSKISFVCHRYNSENWITTNTKTNRFVSLAIWTSQVEMHSPSAERGKVQARHLRFDQILGATEETVFVGHRRHDRTVGRQRRTGVRVVVSVFVVVIVVVGGITVVRHGRFGVSFRIPAEHEWTLATRLDGRSRNVTTRMRARRKQ